jgi:hypothetical protein
MGELKVSEEASQKALLIFKNMKSKRGIAITLQNMGFAEYVRGSISKSAALFKDAIDIFREVYDFPVSLGVGSISPIVLLISEKKRRRKVSWRKHKKST